MICVDGDAFLSDVYLRVQSRVRAATSVYLEKYHDKEIVAHALAVRHNARHATVRDVLGLDNPVSSTLCKAFNRFHLGVWRVLPDLSVTLLPTNGAVGIDTSGFDRSHASKY